MRISLIADLTRSLPRGNHTAAGTIIQQNGECLRCALAERQQAVETGVEGAPGLAGVLRQEEIAVLQAGDEGPRAAARGDQRVRHVGERALQPGAFATERLPRRVSPLAVEDRLRVAVVAVGGAR